MQRAHYQYFSDCDTIREHDSVTRLSYDLRADIQSQHISTHDLYDSFILFFYQNEVANKLDKIHNGCVQHYEKRHFLSN